MEYQGYPTAEELLAKQTSDPDMFRALLYGAAAAVAGGAIWYAIVATTHHELGLVAIAVGWLVAQGVLRGSGKRGIRLQVLSLAITLAAMAGAEYFIVREFAVEYIVETYGAAAAAQVPLFLPLDIATDFVSGAIQEDPKELLFWAIAAWTALRIPAAVKLAAVNAPEPLAST